MKKRFFLSLAVIVICILFSVPVSVYAYTSRADKFKSVSLTGNQANDIASVALAQNQRTNYEFLYTDDWCAMFVSDCAKKAGASKAIPGSGAVRWTGIYESIISAGGSVVSSPKRGDIAFIQWSGSSAYGHVERVYEVTGNRVKTIGGNSGTSNIQGRYWFKGSQVKTHEFPMSAGSVNAYLRPNYEGTTPQKSISISPTIAKTNINKGETCKVGGFVSSTGSNIATVTAGVYRNANGTGGAVNGIEATRKPNSTYYNIANIDAVLYFQNISEPGTYHFVVKATLADGKTTKTASKQFTVKGNQCGQPTINPTDAAGGKTLTIARAGGSDTLNYTVKKDGAVVDNGTAYNNFTKTYTAAGKYTVTAYDTRSGYTKSNTATKEFNIAKVGAPKINQSASGDHMAVNIVSDTSGAAIYYTTSGNTPSTSSTRYNGTLTLKEQKTIRAIAVKNGMANSDVSEMTVKLEEPAAPEGLTLTSADVIPQGESVAVKWNAAEMASSYVATLYQDGKKVSDVSTEGTSASFVLPNEGEYIIKVYASNFVGNSTESEQAVSVKAMAPSTVTFKDWDGSVIKTQEVPYGKDASVPEDPERRGYTFLSWKNIDKITGVKEDIEVTAEYKINTYTVRFYNASGNQVGPAQKVQYQESAASPEADLNDIPTGYVFMGWKLLQASDDSAGDYKAVDSDMKFQAVYGWFNDELPIVAEITSARQNVKTGNYNVTVKLTNYPEDVTTAFLRVALLTKEGKMVKTARAEFEVDEDGTTEKTVTLKYSGVATKASAVILGINGDDQTGSAYSQEVTADVTVQSNEVWSEWTDWTETKPEDVSGEALETVTQYRYADKTTTTSAASSMDGWTKYDSKTTWNNWGNWSGWSTTKQTASDSKQVESRTEYRYYAFVCPVCGGREPFTGKSDCGKYTLGGANAQLIWSPVAYQNSKPQTYSYTTAKLHTTSLGDGKNWNFSAGNRYHTAPGTKDASGPDAVVIRTAYRYRTRSQTTTNYFYKWNDWSEWGETVYTANDNRKVETRTLYRSREKVPVYSPLAGTEDATGNVYHIKGNLTSIATDLNGKLATVMVYRGKNTDPNEDQIQYVGQTTIGENNSYEFDVRPKQDPTPVTGDFTVALGVQGSTGLINVAVIRYERPVYTVTYVNDDGSKISTQQIEEGGNAQVPASPKKDGSRFIGWSENAINVQSNMSIVAMYEPVDYVVTFVDSVNDTVSYETYQYGEKLTPPENPTAEGREFVGWDSILNGIDTVTENMVVNAVYKAEVYTVEFVDEKDTVVSTQKVEFGKAATPPAALDVSGKEFLGWSTENEWWYVTKDMTVKPVLRFMESAAAPSYYTIPYDNYVAMYLETATEDASIYYTLDETVPDTGNEEELYDGGAVILEEFEIEEEVDEENKIVTLHRTARVNAVAVKEGLNDSEVQEIVYTDTVTVPMDVTEATVTFEVNGGTALEENTKTIEIGEEYGELPTPVYTGYDFEGWYTGAEDGALIGAEDICTKDITLYAHWVKNDAEHEHTIVIDPAVESTCQQEGKTEGRHCSECGEVLVAQQTIPKTDHKWSVKEVVKEATCSAEGEVVYECEFCGEQKTEVTPKTEHKPESIEGIPAVEPTCTEPGKTAGSICKDCGEIIQAQEEIPALGHSYGEWETVRAATCKEAGLEQHLCENCGEKETREIGKTEHETEIRNKAKATCHMDGYTGDTYCKVCGELVEAGEIIPKLEHDWNEGTVQTKATCKQSGVKVYTCWECGDKKYEEIPAGEHSGGKATCVKKAVCSECGQEYGDLDPNNHTGKTEVRDQKEPTTAEDGYTGDTYCVDCGQKIKSGKVIPKLASEKEVTIAVQNTVAADGDEITVPVTIVRNSGIAGFSFDVSYDSSILTLKSVAGGSVLSSGQVSTNGNVINWYTSDNVTGNGEILNLVFSVAENTEAEETEISIAPHDGKKNLVDETGTYVDARYEAGVLTIKKGISGDVNGDDDITIADVVVLNRAVLGRQALAEKIIPLADVNGDGDITIGDVVILNRAVLGKEDLQTAREYLLGVGDYLGAGGNATISVDDAAVKPGETFDLPVWVEDNSGLAGIAVSFDIPEGYTLNSITESSLLSKGAFSVDGNTCTWYAQTNMKSDGKLMTLNLTAGENAKNGTVTVGVKNSEGNNFTDEHGASMLVDFVNGRISVKSASVCEENGHSPKKAVRENEVSPACEKEGSYDEVVYCGVCDEEISRETKTIPALEHKWDEGKVTKEAAPGQNGERTYTCSVCNGTKTEEILPTAEDVAKWINALPETLTAKDEETVNAIRSAYNALDSEAKKQITDEVLRKLAAAEDIVKKAKEAAEKPDDSKPGNTESKVTPAPAAASESAAASSTASSQPAVTMGADGTPVGEGASESVAEKAILSARSDEGPAGTVFGTLTVKQKKAAKKSITISWKGVPGASYTIYGNECGKPFQKLQTVGGTSFTQKKLKKGTYYKYIVLAVRGGKVVSASKTVHIATTGGKVGNIKKLTLNKKSVKIKKKKTFQIKAKQVPSSKKLKVKKHRKLTYESSNPAVASVSKKGKVKGLKKGKAIIYVYAQNGVFAKVKVTVK